MGRIIHHKKALKNRLSFYGKSIEIQIGICTSGPSTKKLLDKEISTCKM